MYESIPDARVTYGHDGGRGHETPDTRWFINVTATKTWDSDGFLNKEPMELSLALTAPQMAQVIKYFFYEITWRNKFYAGLLRRLMSHRYAEMTSDTYKSPLWENERAERMRYHTQHI